jgi:hypothetical protein
MEIDLEPGKQPPSGHLYPLSHDELELMRKYLDEMLEVLNRRQARWADYLSLFDFKIIYRPGRENRKANTLSRRANLELKRGSE